jgi:Ca-activated chloride channel family protein
MLRGPSVLVPTFGLFAGVPGTWRTRLASAPWIARALGVSLLVVALARPVHRDLVPLETEGIDILLAIDVSSSMSATDLDPAGRQTRLDVVKETAARFVEGRASDRMGLIVFAAYPDVRCPPTLDHGALRKFLAEAKLVPPRSPEDRTGIRLAVARCVQVLKDSKARSRVVILLTDGQENVGEIPPEAVQKMARQFEVKVYTIAAGLGAQGPFGMVQRIDHGEVKMLAEKTGGEFYLARDADALRWVYEEIDRMEKVELKDPRYRVEERFLPFLLAGIALMLLAVLLEGLVLQEAP